MTKQNNYNNTTDIENLLLSIRNQNDRLKMLEITKDIDKHNLVTEHIYKNYIENNRDSGEFTKQDIKRLYRLANRYRLDTDMILKVTNEIEYNLTDIHERILNKRKARKRVVSMNIEESLLERIYEESKHLVTKSYSQRLQAFYEYKDLIEYTKLSNSAFIKTDRHYSDKSIISFKFKESSTLTVEVKVYISRNIENFEEVLDSINSISVKLIDTYQNDKNKEYTPILIKTYKF